MRHHSANGGSWPSRRSSCGCSVVPPDRRWSTSPRDRSSYQDPCSWADRRPGTPRPSAPPAPGRAGGIRRTGSRALPGSTAADRSVRSARRSAPPPTGAASRRPARRAGAPGCAGPDRPRGSRRGTARGSCPRPAPARTGPPRGGRASRPPWRAASCSAAGPAAPRSAAARATSRPRARRASAARRGSGTRRGRARRPSSTAPPRRVASRPLEHPFGVVRRQSDAQLHAILRSCVRCAPARSGRVRVVTPGCDLHDTTADAGIGHAVRRGTTAAARAFWSAPPGVPVA